jgi:hypothetical protein
MLALFRGLDLSDEVHATYKQTTRILLAGVMFVVLAFVITAMERG